MPPPPLAPHAAADQARARALTSIYAPKLRAKRRVNTMLDNDIQIKPTLSPFHPLPAIGQKLERSTTKVIVFDINKSRPCTREELPSVKSLKIHEYLKPLTPLQVHGLARKPSLDGQRPQAQHLLRENTYDVIEPIYLKATKVKKREVVPASDSEDSDRKQSPKSRFKKAARQVVQETGKLLCQRERISYGVHMEPDREGRLESLPQSPPQKLENLSEIFRSLDMRGRHRDKMKKENSWF